MELEKMMGQVLAEEAKKQAELEKLAYEAAQLQHDLRYAKQKLKEIREEAGEALGLSESMKTPNGTFRRVSYTRKIFDVKRFREEHPDLYEEYIKETHVEFVGFYPPRRAT